MITRHKSSDRQRRLNSLRRAFFFLLGLTAALAVQADSSSVGITDASVTQPTSGSTPLDFTLTRSGDPGYDVVVPYATVDDTAVAGTDYTATSGSVIIPAGATSATVSVPVLAGSNSSSKKFLLKLAKPTGVGAAPAFTPPAQVTAGTLPFQSAVADFNGDGLPDLAVADGATASVTFLFNTTAAGAASPSFTPAGSIGVGARPQYIVAADFNGDGKPDLAVGNYNSLSVSILFNTTAPGDISASFTPAGTISLGDFPASLKVADFNGDGLPDLALVGSNNGTVNVFLNSTVQGASSAGFTLAYSQALGQYGGLTVADFNGDGKPDLAKSNPNSNTVSVLLNTTAPGAGTVTFSAASNLPTGSNPLSLAAGDFNGDGKPDLAVANYFDNTITLLRNTTAPGAMTPSFTPGSPLGAGVKPGSVTVADLNGDGKPDLAVTNFQGGTVTLLYNATAVGGNGISFLNTVSPFVGDSVEFITAADFNGDGRADLAVSSEILGSPYPGAGRFSILSNSTPVSAASLSFATAANFGAGSQPAAIAKGDFNGDGRLDVAVANQASNSVSILLNTGHGTTVTTYGVGSNPVAITVGDFNGDGKPDLAVANRNDNTVSILFNNTVAGASSTSFTPAATLSVGTSPQSIAVGDFNGDGKPDLAVANRFSGSISVLLNGTAPGAASASFTLAASPAVGTQPFAVVVGDFNGDGKPDLAAANLVSNNFSILFNTTPTSTDTTNASFTLAGTSAALGGDPFSAAVGDFNGDGKPDLVSGNLSNGTLSILLNSTPPGASSATFTLAASPAAGNSPYSVVVGDLNGDGKPDLAVANRNDNTSSVLLNTTAPGASSASFALAASPAVGSNPQAVVIGDFNGDGELDLAAANFNGDTVSMLLNTRLAASLSDTRATGTIQSNLIPSVIAVTNDVQFPARVIATRSEARTINVTNKGKGNLVIGNTLAVSGTNSSDFSLGNDTCSNATVAPSSSCTFQLSFSPSAAGTRSALIEIDSNDPAHGKKTVSLSGIGVPPAPTDVTGTPGQGRVTLNWTASEGADSYEVFESTTFGDAAKSPPVATGIVGTSATISGLSAGTRYYFQIRAGSSGAFGPASEEIAVKLPLVPTVTISFNPTSVVSGQSSTLNWSSADQSYATVCTSSADWPPHTREHHNSLTVTRRAPRTYTYTLECTNSSGSDTESATLTVAR